VACAGHEATGTNAELCPMSMTGTADLKAVTLGSHLCAPTATQNATYCLGVHFTLGLDLDMRR